MIRLDRGPMYMWVMGALFATSLGLLITGPLENTSITKIPTDLQDALSVGIFVGSGICIWGYCTPTTHIQLAYKLALWGFPTVVGSLATYCWALWDNDSFIVSVVGASVSVGIIGGTIQNVWRFTKELKRIKSNIRFLRRQEDTDNVNG